MPYERALITALTVVALALRLAVAGDSPFGDELFTHEIATRDGLGDVIDGVAGDLEITPPLYFILAWLCQQLGDPDFWLRVPSLVAGTLTVPAIWAVGRRSVGAQAGVVAAALWALSPFAIFYSTEARGYALMTLLAAAATYALLRAVADPGRRWWIAYAALAAAALYSHYTAVFAIGVHAAWALWFHRDEWKRLALAYAGAFVAYIPWIPELVDDRENKVAQAAIGVLEPFGVDTFFEHIGHWSLGTAYVSMDDLPGIPLLIVALGLLAAALATGARRLDLRPEAILLAALALGAPLGATAWTLLAEGSIFIDRNLLVALPALALCTGAVLTAPPPRIAAGLTAAFVCLFAWLAIDSLGEEFSRPDYKAAGEYISEHAQPGDPVVDGTVLDPSNPPSDQLRVHVPDEQPFFKLHVQFPDERVQREAVEAARGRRLYLVGPDVDPADPPGQLVETRRWPGRFTLRLSVYRVR